jgi:hypothetical protein
MNAVLYRAFTMAIETVGTPPPEADHIKTVLEQQLPNIIASFNQVLRNEYGITGVSVGGFSVVPARAVAGTVVCDQESCSIT